VGLIGGLLTSTLLTLVFVPAMYTVFDDIQSAILHVFGRTPQMPTAPAPALAAGGAVEATIPAGVPDALPGPNQPRVPAGAGVSRSSDR
jgi:hypothetical protein